MKILQRSQGPAGWGGGGTEHWAVSTCRFEIFLVWQLLFKVSYTRYQVPVYLFNCLIITRILGCHPQQLL